MQRVPESSIGSSIRRATVVRGVVMALAFGAGVLLVTSSAHAGAAAYSVNTSGPSKWTPLRRELSAAQRDLAKATAAAARVGSASESVKAAQVTLAKARRDYHASLAAARAALASDPTVGPLQKDVRDIEARLREQTDLYTRAIISKELLAARNVLNDAEWDHLGVDPDVAIGRAAIDDAANALKQAQADQQSAIQQDPAVAAAKQRVLAVRMQLRGR